MGEGVLAALTDDDHFELAVRLDEPLDYLPDSSLLRLRGHAAGLADGS